MKNVTAIIAAAGYGKRMGQNVNKQFLKIKDMPVLAHTLRVFQFCSSINEIIVVCKKEEIDLCKRSIIARYNYSKVVHVAVGGKERQISVYNGLMNISDKCDIVIVHDGARPFVKDRIIMDVIDGALNYGGACTAVRVKDTIKIGKNGLVSNTLDRSFLWNIQTPQAFKRDILVQAYESAIKDGFSGTDDSSLVERLGYKVKLIDGDYKNIKITTPDDLIIGEAIYKKFHES